MIRMCGFDAHPLFSQCVHTETFSQFRRGPIYGALHISATSLFKWTMLNMARNISNSQCRIGPLREQILRVVAQIHVLRNCFIIKTVFFRFVHQAAQSYLDLFSGTHRFLIFDAQLPGLF